MSNAKFLTTQDLDDLIGLLKKEGWSVIAPTRREEMIAYAPIDSISDLPKGITDDQEAGTYKLKPRNDGAFFGYNVGMHSWKKYLLPPKQKIFSVTETKSELKILPAKLSREKLAFLGVRACELSAIKIQDKVFLEGRYVDEGYKARRENSLIIVAQCTQAAPTCFCVSMKSGPKAKTDYDLALTEVVEPQNHYFVIEGGSTRGEKLLAKLKVRNAKSPETGAALEREARACQQLRKLDAEEARKNLKQKLEHENWEAVAQRCLSCANCTMVCPTCFCTTVEDKQDIVGEHSERWRSWDSCFNDSFTHMHGGSVRTTTKSKYRHWLVHKLSTWHDQFATSGCVGCGRCIAWCPVGIDLTAEALKFK